MCNCSELMRRTPLSLTLAPSHDGRGDWIPAYAGMTALCLERVSHRFRTLTAASTFQSRSTRRFTVAASHNSNGHRRPEHAQSDSHAQAQVCLKVDLEGSNGVRCRRERFEHAHCLGGSLRRVREATAGFYLGNAEGPLFGSYRRPTKKVADRIAIGHFFRSLRRR